MKRVLSSAPVERDATRHRLLVAAGELFAQRGFDATSIRDIAKKSRTNIAAVNYHYSTKDNLYLASVQYVADKMVARRDGALEGLEPCELSPAQAAAALKTLIEREVHAYMSTDIPAWYAPLLLRALLTKSAVVETLYEQILHPDHVVVRQLLKAVSPGLSEQETTLWAYSITGQIVFYCLGRVPILMEQRRADYSSEFVARVARHLTDVVFSGLGIAKTVKGSKRRTGRNQ